ncbi:MAG: hypothetical protein M3198_06860 [Actinomycetota bacterium]|nr:hypothetical protein [Actinomycetota bacterium]
MTLVLGLLGLVLTFLGVLLHFAARRLRRVDAYAEWGELRGALETHRDDAALFRAIELHDGGKSDPSSDDLQDKEDAKRAYERSFYEVSRLVNLLDIPPSVRERVAMLGADPLQYARVAKRVCQDCSDILRELSRPNLWKEDRIYLMRNGTLSPRDPPRRRREIERLKAK